MFQSLLVNQAELDSVEVSEDQVNFELDQRIRFFEQQIGGREKLEEFYGKSIAEINLKYLVVEWLPVHPMEIGLLFCFILLGRW